MIKAKEWKGKDLKGKWQVTLKVDGVRVIVKDGAATSRAGKALYNIPKLPDGDYECYLGSFKSSISAVKTHDGVPIDKGSFFSLDPIDTRLLAGITGGELDFNKANIDQLMSLAVAAGYEGLVLRQDDLWLKVKPVITHDVVVTGYQAGTGKHEGRMGALLTERGKVGTGFTDAEREEYTESYIVGKVIEVKAMMLTEAGKFRHPAFVRIRLDKES